MKVNNLIGERFGRLIVLERTLNSRLGQSMWLCLCDCGIKKVIQGSNLKAGITKSCGCLQSEISSKRLMSHGGYGTGSYNSWHGIKGRCLNKSDKDYFRYGRRGIKICDKWLKFEGFYQDMGDKPEHMSIDRIDNNKGYYKENCRWATDNQQARNRSDTIFIAYGGKTMSMVEWSEYLNIDYDKFKHRVKTLKWSMDKICSNLDFCETCNSSGCCRWGKKMKCKNHMNLWYQKYFTVEKIN